jgi:hypothetical protein
MADPYGWHDWHGRIGGRIHPKSHVVGSDWNMEKREKAAKATKAVKATNAVKATKATNTKRTAKRTNAQRNVSRKNLPYSEKWNVHPPI